VADLGIASRSLKVWVQQAEIDAGERDGLTSTEHEELASLRRENRVLREERDILKKPKRVSCVWTRGTSDRDRTVDGLQRRLLR
jgi:transposase